MAATFAASPDVSAKIEIVSCVRHAGTSPRVREQALRRLEANDIVEARRHASRACRVRAERERHEPGRDRHARARARSAGDILLVEHARADAVGRARSDQARGELIEVGLADDDGPGRFQELDDGRRAFGRIGEIGAGARGRQALDVDVVFDRERNAGQRPFCGRRRAPAPAPSARARSTPAARPSRRCAGTPPR